MRTTDGVGGGGEAAGHCGTYNKNIWFEYGSSFWFNNEKVK